MQVYGVLVFIMIRENHIHIFLELDRKTHMFEVPKGDFVILLQRFPF